MQFRNDMFEHLVEVLRIEMSLEHKREASMLEADTAPEIRQRNIKYSLTYSPTHLLTHSLIYSLTHLLTYSLTHLLTYSPTNSLTYLLTHQDMAGPFVFGGPHHPNGSRLQANQRVGRSRLPGVLLGAMARGEYQEVAAAGSRRGG